MDYQCYAFGQIFASLVFCKSCEELDKENNERIEANKRKILEEEILKQKLEEKNIDYEEKNCSCL
tara:strand:+ start:999 stop:1193 length:195 start_codon:yes stop_codon:yes gene_type:complete